MFRLEGNENATEYCYQPEREGRLASNLVAARESMAGARGRSQRGCRQGPLRAVHTSADPPGVCGCKVYQTADERTSRSALC